MSPSGRESGAASRSSTAPHGTTATAVPRAFPQGRVAAHAPAFGLSALGWCVLAGFVPIERTVNGLFGNSYVLQAVVLGWALLCVVAGRARKPNWVGVWVAGMFLIPLAGLVSGDVNRGESFVIGVFFATYLLVVSASLRYQIHVPRFLPAAMVAFASMQTISALFGLLQAVGFAPLGIAARGGRVNGLATHPNVLGLMAAVVLLLCLYLLLRGVRRRWFAALVLGVPNLIALALTGSLSAFLALALGVLVLMTVLRRVLLGLGLGVALSAICAAWLYLSQADWQAFVLVIQERVDEVLTGGDTYSRGSLEIRAGTYEYALNYVRADPFVGVGLDGTYSAADARGTVVHNFLLRAWFHGGVLFGGFVIVLAIRYLYALVISWLRRQDALAIAMLTVLVVYGSVSALYTQNEYWMIILCAVAMLQNGKATDGDSVHSGQDDRTRLDA